MYIIYILLRLTLFIFSCTMNRIFVTIFQSVIYKNVYHSYRLETIVFVSGHLYIMYIDLVICESCYFTSGHFICTNNAYINLKLCLYIHWSLYYSTAFSPMNKDYFNNLVTIFLPPNLFCIDLQIFPKKRI